jgi:hypothetical protein
VVPRIRGERVADIMGVGPGDEPRVFSARVGLAARVLVESY